MPYRWDKLIRYVGALMLAMLGANAGAPAWEYIKQLGSMSQFTPPEGISIMLTASLALFGLGLGYLIAPIFLKPLEGLYEGLSGVPPIRMLGTTVGLTIGLLLGALAAIPLSMLQDPLGNMLPFFATLTMAYLGAATVGNNPGAFLGLFRQVFGGAGTATSMPSSGYILLDTSVIIDGRVADVVETGFIEKTLLVPRFVLDELQQVADSSDDVKRRRGRRGLEMLNRLQESTKVVVEISDHDAPAVNEVDGKLVQVAERLNASIMTNDYNLNRVADIQGIRVLNLNELANSVKTLVLPGESMSLALIQSGKEEGQAVGYLEDGTMVVVENAGDHIGSSPSITVSRVLQTVAGRMIFATLDETQS